MAFCWKLRRRKGPPAFFLDNGEDDLPWTDTDDLEWARSKRGGREIVWDGDQETDPWINRDVISDKYCRAKSEGHQRKRDYGTLAWWPRVQSAEWLGRCARQGGNRISSIPHQGGSWKLPVRSMCHTNASVNILGMHRLCTTLPLRCNIDAVQLNMFHNRVLFAAIIWYLYIKSFKSLGYGSQDCPPKFIAVHCQQKEILHIELLATALTF